MLGVTWLLLVVLVSSVVNVEETRRWQGAAERQWWICSRPRERRVVQQRVAGELELKEEELQQVLGLV